MSTAHPPTAQAPMRTILSHVIVPILMGLIMCAAYLGGFHKPSPHHVPVAVVGQAQQAGPLAAKVQDAFGDEADVRTIATPEQATDQLKHLKISAAYVPGDGKAELLTAGGASDTTKSVVEKMFRPVAEKQHDALTVKDVAPLTEDDPAGQNGFFFLVALTVAAYATSIAIGAAAASRPFAQRIALAAGAAVVISTIELAIAAWGYDMFGGHVLATWALSLLYTAGVLTVGVGLHPIVGRFATLLYSAIFVALNFTSSGGVFAPVMQPSFFGWLHDFWIGSGFVEALRRIIYFPDASIAGPLTILFGWLVVGLLCLAAGCAVEQRRVARARELEKAASSPVGRHAEQAHQDERDELDPETEEELEENVAV